MRFVIQQAVVADYRLPVYQLLREDFGRDFSVVCGDVDFSPTITTVEGAKKIRYRVNNFFLCKRKILIQFGAFRGMLKSDVVVFSYNLRILSNLPLIWLRKLLGKRSYVWGHIDGKSCLTRRFGFLYTAFADGFIAYTETQAEVMRERNRELMVIPAPNACFSEKDCVVNLPSEAGQHVLYLGRLVAGKKPMLLLQGYRKAIETGALPRDIRLVIVGDGPERGVIEKYIKKHDLGNYVELLGHISDKKRLSSLFADALCCVSAGYVGLSVTQTFAYGIGALIADNEPHSPEIEACIEGWNALYFSSDNAESLANGLSQFYKEREKWISRREEISDWTKNKYSYEQMAQAFAQLFKV